MNELSAYLHQRTYLGDGGGLTDISEISFSQRSDDTRRLE
jgi:hypothetical protein